MAFSIITAVAALLLAVPAQAQEMACGVGHLVTIGADGAIIRGSKERLRQAIGNGLPVRIGWQLDANRDGTVDVAHWTDAGFVTEFEGEIFAQLDDIQRQSPMRGQTRVLMPAGRQRWSGLLGTTGMLESHLDDGSQPNSVRVRSTWCVDPRAEACAPQWRLAYRHDADGQALEGSREALLDAVRRGAPLRLAWGLASSAGPTPVVIEHAAEPEFVTVMNREHIFVQLPEHIAQASYSQPDAARFDRASVMWRGLMGSDGTFDAVFVDRASGQEVRRLPQRAGIAWFAEVPRPECEGQAPLTLAVPNGVRRR